MVYVYLRHKSVLFLEPLIPMFWIPGDICPGFQNPVGSLICILPFLRAMDSSDSPLVWPPLTSCWPAWQPRIFYPYSWTRIFEMHFASKHHSKGSFTLRRQRQINSILFVFCCHHNVNTTIHCYDTHFFHCCSQLGPEPIQWWHQNNEKYSVAVAVWTSSKTTGIWSLVEVLNF